ncbi:MAG: hypothetical protein K2X39_03180 [Silvanigrellaceae bacterium]|nr:hypothetical protein [Silvanigrellaceae bacterium]
MTIENQLFSFLIPEEILTDFDINNIEDTEELLIIELVEKQQNISKLCTDETLVGNGFMNPLELQHFPMNGKKCVLKLIRRRWKQIGSSTGNYFNTYSYAVTGTKVTPSFGAFLKEIGL